MQTFLDAETKTLNPRLWLSVEYTKRKSKNPSYSIRAFANFLKLDASTLSQVLSGKRQISGKIVSRLADDLGADPVTKSALINFSNKKILTNQADVPETGNDFRELNMDAFSLISDWYHYAILELTFTKNFKSDVNWIASQLSITPSEADIAVERLKRLKLLEELDGKLIKTETFITNFKDGVTSEALKNLQRSILTMGLDAIDNTPPSEKDITSMTFAIDESKLQEARELIKKFRREMSKLLESGNQTRVYHLGVQLYPVSKKDLKEIK